MSKPIDKIFPIENPGDMSFSDDDEALHQATGEERPSQHRQESQYFHSDAAGPGEEKFGETDRDEFDDQPDQTLAAQKKPPLYKRPFFYLIILLVLVVVGSFMMSLAKQRKRKAAHFGGEQPFAQPAPPVPGSPGGSSGAAVATTPQQQFATPPPSVPSAAPTPQALPQQPAKPDKTAGNTPPSVQPANVPAVPSAGVSADELNKILNTMRAEMRTIVKNQTVQHDEVRQLRAKVDYLASLQKKTSQVKESKILPSSPAAAPTIKPPAVNLLASLSIKAIRKGKAWIAGPGGVYAVNPGDMLPGNIRVTEIDPDNLEVTTSAGVIRYRKTP